MTIRTIIAEAANAVVRLAGRVQRAARVDAVGANGRIWELAPVMAHRGWPKHLPVSVSLDRYDGRDLTRAPFPVYAATRTGRRSC
ncbi:hypothetical protein ACUSIJ_00940 [Pseudochelatococcus sp. B33]